MVDIDHTGTEYPYICDQNRLDGWRVVVVRYGAIDNLAKERSLSGTRDSCRMG